MERIFFKRYLRLSYISLIVIFIGWISLFGETIQLKYRNITFLGLVIFLIVSFFYKKPERFSVIDLSLFLYLFFVTLSLLFSENKAVALEWYTRDILPFPLVYLSMRNIDKKGIPAIALSLCLFTILISLIGISEAIFHKNIIYERWVENIYYNRYIYKTPRIMSTLIHPTVFGSFLLGCLPFSFFLATNIKAPYKLLIKIFIPMIIFGIIFSFSRGNIMGLTVSSLLYLFLIKRSRYIKYIFVGLIILILLSSTALKREFHFSRFSLRGISTIDWGNKVEKTRIAIKMLNRFPLLGIGFNHYRLKFDQYCSNDWKQNIYECSIPDNMYLSILTETGLLGFSSFMLFLFLLFKKCFHILKLVKDTIEKEFLVACLCGIIGLLISMNTYDLLYWSNPLLLFWFLIGSMRAIELSSCI